MDFDKIISKKGKISYNELKYYISQVSLSEFTSNVKHPFIVGKELFQGKLERKDEALQGDSTNTMKFNAASLRNELKGPKIDIGAGTSNIQKKVTAPEKEGISSAIFYLKKQSFSYEPKNNTFSLGRSEVNDIVIADYAISKKHCSIIFFFGKYFITDFGSTNGVDINGTLSKPNVKFQLPVNSTITFGRLAFVFLSPTNIYRTLKREQ